VSSCQDSTGQNLQVEHRRNCKGKMGKVGKEELTGKVRKEGRKGKMGTWTIEKWKRRRERERLDRRN